MELWKIILGIVTAIVLIFIKDANSKAHKQINASTRLYSYLNYWKGFVLDNDMFSVYYKGVDWNNKIDILKKTGAELESYSKLRESLKAEIFGMKEELLSDESIKKLDRETIDKLLNKIPQFTAEYLLQNTTRTQQNIIDGKTFITDEEASYLGSHTALIAIELKMELIGAMNSIVGLIVIFMSSKDDFDLKDHADEIIKIIWKCILISKHIDELSKKMTNLQTYSPFDLTIRNLRGRF